MSRALILLGSRIQLSRVVGAAERAVTFRDLQRVVPWSHCSVLACGATAVPQDVQSPVEGRVPLPAELFLGEDRLSEERRNALPSKVLPGRVRNSASGSQANVPSESLRSMTSEKTPCVGCPILNVLPDRSVGACVKVSSAQTVEPSGRARRPARCNGPWTDVTYPGRGKSPRPSGTAAGAARLHQGEFCSPNERNFSATR